MNKSELEDLRERALDSLSVFAREILGFDYFVRYKPGDPEHGKEIHTIEWEGEIRECGVVDWGPHGQMVQFMEDLTDSGMLVCSRGAMKTTIGIAWVLWEIIKNPNIRVIIHMATEGEAHNTVRSLRTYFETNEKLREVFGDYAGTRKDRKLWSDREFIVSKRTRVDRNPTVVASSTDKNTVGKRADLLWIDDPVRPQDRNSELMLEKAKNSYRALNKLLDPGARKLVTLTPYDERDLCHMIRGMPDQFAILELPCGMEAVTDNQGGYKLVGTPRYPHHTLEFLEKKLREDGKESGPAWFNMSYALTITNPADQVFFRESFREVAWSPRMARMNGYVLTDAAVSDDDASCFSVAAIVLLDHDDTAYIADMVIGHWTPSDFRENLCDLVTHWASRCRLIAIHMEDVAMNAAFRVMIQEELNQRNIRLAWEGIARRGSEANKRTRIRGLTNRVSEGRLVVVDTIRRYYSEAGQAKVLWDAAGFYDQQNDRHLPDGELVRQFVGFRWNAKGKTGARMDIPDALADLDAVNGRHSRYCVPTRFTDVAGRDVPLERRPERWGGRATNSGRGSGPVWQRAYARMKR